MEMENREKLTYKTAYAELQEILNSIENNKTDIDVISEKLKRATVLINFCKKNLSQIEIDVEQLISDMEKA